ncbi:DUF1127 domain-containing protein [Roseovarius arcticus]|uniref:DUF1127 domain-containing protein n=1 Tax=Roseovarius arcticus TaxID=2547404 RepID=UPI001FEA84EE|nr:DUF1127 domain-containing protein [Roseovarius arcticus]
MTDTHSMQQLGGVFVGTRTVFQQAVGKLQAARSRRKLYCRTITELSALSDQELRDLAIPRSHITRLAWETAYGC